jgi:hypothetical protein
MRAKAQRKKTKLIASSLISSCPFGEKELGTMGKCRAGPEAREERARE